MSYDMMKGWVDDKPKRKNPSRSQWKQVVENQNHECARCEKILDVRDIHIHHHDGDRSNTVIENLRAVCGSCHNILEHEKALKSVEEKRSKNSKEEDDEREEDEGDYDNEPIIDTSPFPTQEDLRDTIGL